MNHLIIAGRADCLLEDIAALHKIGVKGSRGHYSFDYMAIGLHAVNRFLMRIEYVATYHPVEIPKIKEWREAIGGNTDYKVISHEPKPGVDIIEPENKPTGSSALLGVFAAMRMGYTRIILCGCPMIGKSPESGNYEEFQIGWEKVKDEIKDKARSMSGWTMELLGMPTIEWLMEGGR